MRWPWTTRGASRGLKLFGVGNEKTGTHSLAGLFSHYRAEHEPEVPEFRELVCRNRRGEIRPGELERYFRAKERRLHLEVDSSFLNGEVIDALVPCYPRARYVLTVREPRSWLDSMINQSLRYKSVDWLELRALRVGSGGPHPPEEEPLSERGLYTLDGYLSEWARHNRRVLEHVPPSQLLVLCTQDITDRVETLAAFAGVPVDTLDIERSHEFRGPVKYGVLEELDQDYLADKIERHCGRLAEQLLTSSAPG